jgi:hypothetical protein
MVKYKIYYCIILFLIIKCVFGDENLEDLEIKERKWKEELTGNIMILLRVLWIIMYAFPRSFNIKLLL